MEFTHDVVVSLRHKLGDELAFNLDAEDVSKALAAFDRSVLAVVLGEGSVMGATAPALTRGQKAAATRAKNKRAVARKQARSDESSDEETSATSA